MMGTCSLTLETGLGERVCRGFGVEAEAEGLFVVVKGGLTVDASEERLLSAERLAKEKVDASECRIEALLLRGSVVEGLCCMGGE